MSHLLLLEPLSLHLDSSIKRNCPHFTLWYMLQALNLSASDDLLCKNLMCEHVGDPCICRLSAVLDKLPSLEHLDLSNNNLSALPEVLSRLPKLITLDLRGNHLQEVPLDFRQQLANVQVRITTIQSITKAWVPLEGILHHRHLSAARLCQEVDIRSRLAQSGLATEES